MSKTHTLEMICEEIRNRIFAKELFPGSQIVEDELAKDSGVSRTMVRNAMITLQKEGLVTIIPNKGSFVINPAKKDVISFYQVRKYLELGLGELAIERITEAHLSRMEENYLAQADLLQDFSIEKFAILNRDFHWTIVEAADNEFYAKYLLELYNIQRMYLIFFDKSQNNANSLINHRKILDGLKEKSIEKYTAGVIADCSIKSGYGGSVEE